MDKTFDKLQARLFKLEQVINSAPPIDPKLMLRHELKVANARNYKKELLELIDELSILHNVVLKVVNENAFNSQLGKCDFGAIILDGTYCSLAEICNWGNPIMYLIWIAPFSKL